MTPNMTKAPTGNPADAPAGEPTVWEENLAHAVSQAEYILDVLKWLERHGWDENAEVPRPFAPRLASALYEIQLISRSLTASSPSVGTASHSP